MQTRRGPDNPSVRSRSSSIAGVLANRLALACLLVAGPAISGPLPACGKGDDRTPVPVWNPKVNAQGNLSSDPPQRDGQIVYIALDHALADAPCDNDQLFSFTRPENIDDPAQGGLAVNVQGNAQPVKSGCRLRGYYRNKEVEGMHQGWLETWFGAVKQGAVSPGTHCLGKPVER